MPPNPDIDPPDMAFQFRVDSEELAEEDILPGLQWPPDSLPPRFLRRQVTERPVIGQHRLRGAHLGDLVTAYGEPFSAKSLTGTMAHWCKLAGLPKGLTLHGLRKSLGVYLAEAEASTRQLMDVLGHDDIDHAELYSREASQVRLAVQGMDRVVRLVTRKPMLGEPFGEPVGEPPRKPLINNDYGGPGGRPQIIDFINFFVGTNREFSRIVPYGSAAHLARTRDSPSTLLASGR